VVSAMSHSGFGLTNIQIFFVFRFVPTLRRQTHTSGKSPSQDDLRGSHVVLGSQLFDHRIVADDSTS
jgi:hypothetical protein